MTDDRVWFEQMVRNLSRPAMKFANVLVHDSDLAEEIVQEAFARSWASSSTPSPEVEFRRFLYRIITNLAHDYFRRQSRRATFQLPDPADPNPIEMFEKRSGDEAMRAALNVLGLRERQAIYLRYFEDLSFAETARIIGARQGTVRVMVHRALSKLRRELSSHQVAGQVAI
jgi:RNA polymerase sigma factor (sigma-70 family)